MQNKIHYYRIGLCSRPFVARDNRWLLSRVQRLAGPAGGQGPFVPVGVSNRDKMSPFCPGWCLQPGQMHVPRSVISRSYPFLYIPVYRCLIISYSSSCLSPQLLSLSSFLSGEY